ncbi:hypothetical protein BRAS3843_100037 [Bradyrhizobium sp. STM 3843]|uniref:hypothetical protein n=1 Tax=Bradyrhizobium sp. STM 3843 TaxID=551947 RepID=UPI000240A81D|nr:hypothetical protein [Bradyrhizobium sp. STM 3843]CCE04142.1 hypothetical protein BRAS3843_100037 [Bradyrhizobium sp. STM 3843]
MPDERRNFIERSDSITGNLYGQPMSLQRIADNFALYGLQKRVAALESLDAELREGVETNPGDLRRHARMLELRRQMGSAHVALRNAGR